MLQINLEDTLSNIRNSIKYQVDDTNLIKKHLLRFDKSTDECFHDFVKYIEKGIQFESINTISKDWKFTKVPPNIQSYIPLKVYTSDFDLKQFPMREHKEIFLSDTNEFDTYEDHHIITIFYPNRKFTFNEIQSDLIRDLEKGYSDTDPEEENGTRSGG